MKVQFNIKQLRSGLARLTSMPGSHRSISGLSAMTITADIEGVAMTRTTGAAKLSIITDSEVFDDGAAIVPINSLISHIQRAQAESVTFESDSQFLHITAGKYKGRIATIDKAELNADFSPAGECRAAIEVPMEDMISRLKAVSSCASALEPDALLCGVSMRVHEGSLRIVATDRKRFLMAHMPDINSSIDVTVPLAAVESIVKAFGDSVGYSEFAFYDNGLVVKHVEGTAIYALMQGEYPSYSGLLNMIESAETMAKVSVDRVGFLAALRAATPFADKDETIIIEIRDAALVVIGDNKTTDRAEQEVEANCTAHEGPPINVNAKYIFDVASAMRAETLAMSLVMVNEKAGARAITMQEEDRTGFVGLIKQ